MEVLKRRFLFICILAAIVFAGYRITGKFTHRYEPPHETVARIVAEWNTMLPRTVSDDLTITDAEADGDILRLNAQMSPRMEFRPQGQEHILHDIAARQMCKPMKPLLKKNISAQYRIHYHDYGTEKVYDVTVLPTDCG